MARVVTLVVAFCRLFGKVAGTFEFYFVIYECRLSGGDIQRW